MNESSYFIRAELLHDVEAKNLMRNTRRRGFSEKPRMNLAAREIPSNITLANAEIDSATAVTERKVRTIVALGVTYLGRQRIHVFTI